MFVASEAVLYKHAGRAIFDTFTCATEKKHFSLSNDCICLAFVTFKCHFPQSKNKTPEWSEIIIFMQGGGAVALKWISICYWFGYYIAIKW